MARALVSQRPERLAVHPRVSASPETMRQLVELWREPKGIDSLRPINKVEPDYATDMENYMFLNGQLHSRYGTELLGNDAASPVLQVTDLWRANGKKVTIRFCTRHIEVMNYFTGAWRVFPVDLHGDEEDFFTWTSWADKLLFSNFIDGLWELDFETYIIQKVDGAPGAKHLTVFGNRVVATATNTSGDFYPSRIQWSVKNDYTDWTGIGSGFEDLYGAPGGVVDESMKTIPITDEAAFIIRATTIWQMSESGVAIAPFRFSRIFRVGSPARESIVETPRGIVFINEKSVYTVSIGIFQDIGLRIIKRLIEDFGDIRGAYGIYDPIRDEYRVAHCKVVFRYRWDEGGWTKDKYPYLVKSLGNQIAGRTGYPIDSLPGIIDNLQGTIDDLVVIRPYDDKIHIVPESSLISVIETSDSTQDQINGGSFVDAPLSITSGVVNLNRWEASEILEGHLEYETDEEQTFVFEFLPGVGTSVTQITVKVLAVTTDIAIQRLHLAEHSRLFRFRIRSGTLGQFNLLALGVAGVEVKRAS